MSRLQWSIVLIQWMKCHLSDRFMLKQSCDLSSCCSDTSRTMLTWCSDCALSLPLQLYPRIKPRQRSLAWSPAQESHAHLQMVHACREKQCVGWERKNKAWMSSVGRRKQTRSLQLFYVPVGLAWCWEHTGAFCVEAKCVFTQLLKLPVSYFEQQSWWIHKISVAWKKLLKKKKRTFSDNIKTQARYSKWLSFAQTVVFFEFHFTSCFRKKISKPRWTFTRPSELMCTSHCQWL